MYKILFITPSFSRGGAEKNILNIINNLSEKDFEISLIICTKEISYLNLLNKKINVLILGKKNVSSSLFGIYKIILKQKPSIVFTSALHLVPPLIIMKMFVFHNFLKITRVPSLPSNRLGKKDLKSTILNSLNNRFISKSNYIIAQTPEMKDEIINYYNSPEEKVITINNIVDFETVLQKSKEPLNLIKDDFVFLASGSLYSVKGFDLLIKAFSFHLKKYPKSKLFVLGNESIEKGYKKYLENIINDLKINDRVLLLGHQDNPYKYYKFSDVFVLSSIKEGFPNVVLENIVLNKPVLVTDCVNYGNLISPNNGIIISKNSIEELIKGLEEIRNINYKPIKIENFDYNNWLKKFFK